MNGFANLMTYIKDILTADPTLQSYFPGNAVRLYWEWAPASDETGRVADIFPYITFACPCEGVPGPWGFFEGDLGFAVHDYGPNALDVVRIRSAVMAVFERRFYEHVDIEGIEALRIWYVSDEGKPASTMHERVHKRILTFRIRFFDQALVENVSQRVQDTGGY
jgi:hypothetical protein